MSQHSHAGARLRGDHRVPSSRAEAEAWLQKLPSSDAHRAAEQIKSMLSTMNTVDVPARSRLEVLEALRETVSTVNYRLFDRKTGTQLPLTKSLNAEVTLLSQIHNLLAMGYAWAAVSFAMTGTRYDKPSHAMAIHRAILYFSAVCCDAYRVYRPVPKGVWLAMHELVKKAQEHQLLKFPVTDKLNAFKPQTTITHVYKQILLASALDPYKLPHGEIDELYDRCNQWAVHALLLTPPCVPSGKCQFVIDLNADKPGSSLKWKRRMDEQMHYLVLDTTHLVVAMYGQFQSLQQDVIREQYTHDSSKVRNRSRILDNLITAWGAKLKRKSMRLTVNDKREIIHGFDGITYFLNGESELQCTERSGEDIRGGLFRGEQLRDETAAACLGQWTCIDESANGVQLSKCSEEPIPNLIGHLIAVSRPVKNEKTWDVGVVRWMRNDQTENVTMGVYKFGPVAEAVLIQDVGAPSIGNTDAPATAAVLVSVPEDETIRRSLIVPKGRASSGQNYIMTHRKQVSLIRTRDLRISTGYLDWLDFDVVQQIVDLPQASGHKGAA